MFRNVFALLGGAVLLMLGLMFSLLVLVVVAVFALAIGGYVAWKTRKLRRTLRAQASNGSDGQVIDGEAIVVEEYRVTTKHALPGDSSRR